MISKIKICGISQPDIVEVLNRLRPEHANLAAAKRAEYAPFTDAEGRTPQEKLKNVGELVKSLKGAF